MKRALALLSLAVMCLLLSACSQETDIWLYKGEQWKIIVTAAFDPDALPTFSVGTEIVPGFELGADVPTFNESLFDAAMEQAVAQYESMGVEAHWRKGRRGKDVTYIVEVKGRGWDHLKQVIAGPPSQQGQIQAQAGSLLVVNVGNNQVRYVLSTPSDSSGAGMLFPQTYRLHGGKIISSNALKVQGGTATWRSPQGPMEAVLTPASASDLSNPAVLAVAGGGVLVVGGILVYFLFLHPSPLPRRPGIGLPIHRPVSLRRAPHPGLRRRRW